MNDVGRSPVSSDHDVTVTVTITFPYGDTVGGNNDAMNGANAVLVGEALVIGNAPEQAVADFGAAGTRAIADRGQGS